MSNRPKEQQKILIMDKAQKRKLETQIKLAVAGYNKYFRSVNAINEMCEEIYGTTPSDVDCDEIIDCILGGGGFCKFMTAELFDTEMRKTMRLNKTLF